MLEIYNYNAGKGDCLRLHFTGILGQKHNIIIDSGVIRFGPRFHAICKKIEKENESIDLLLLTHMDEDHLGGLLWNLRNEKHLKIAEVRMNGTPLSSTYLSTRQNNEVYRRLMEQYPQTIPSEKDATSQTEGNDVAKERTISILPAVTGDKINIDGVEIQILWPTKKLASDFYTQADSANTYNTPLSSQGDYGYPFSELAEKNILAKDTSQSNRNSIIFELTYKETRMLFTGDAWAEDILKVAKGQYDLIKLPHHGSVRNISDAWKNLNCNQYLVCTDGVMHPDKQTFAKLQKWNGNITVFGSNPWWNQMILPGEMESLKQQSASPQPDILITNQNKVETTITFIEGEKIIWEN